MAIVSRRRAAAVLVTVLVSLVGLSLRLVWVQGVRASDYSALARAQRVRKIDLSAQRGTIYDRAGRELAMSVPARTVYANPRQIPDKDGTARILSPLLGPPPQQLYERLSRPKGFVYLARRIEVDRAKQIEALKLIGVGTIVEPRRVYPGSRLAANVVGYVGEDGEGLAGLEEGFESLLKGHAGLRVLEQDPQGRPIPQGQSREQPPEPGADVVLTLDRDIQFAAENALAEAVASTGAKGGTVVVIRPRTGEVLAMASAPTFDPNDPHGVDPETTRNRAVTDIYEPGSANKVVTAAAALETGVVTAETKFGVPAVITVAGHQFHDAHGHAAKSMTFKDIIAESSNVGTIQAGLRLGRDRLYEYLRKFGYGRTTALGFPGEAPGMLPQPGRWSGTSLPTMAIGQGLSVTALQIVRVLATVANDGVMVEPRLVSGWVDRDGTMHRAPESRSARVLQPSTAATLRAILERATTDGTGTAAQIPGYTVAGKTGTAQKATPHGYQGYMASFIGFVPSTSPELAIGAVLDDPSPIWGGVVSAPIFRQVGQAALRILRVPPTGSAVFVAPDPAREVDR
jgi:cell division protein FtsI (penicillin-binding protein 3)